MAKQPSTSSVTADDVAELAGVSRWTVNRAFKPDASISISSRNKVLKAAAQLEYVPDLLAAGLASDKTNLVSLLVDDFSNPHKLVMLERITRILRKNGWDSLLINTLSEDDANEALLSASQRRVDAAVLIGSRFDDQALETALGARRAKKLIVFARFSNNPNTISICCDDVLAMNTITNHILENGYRKPLFLAGPQTQSAHLLRKDTFVELWRKTNGMAASVVAVGAYDPEIAYRCVADYFAKHERSEWPDILVCENDSIAIGAIDALRLESNLRIPEDIAVIGFDDVPRAANPGYDLTTYRQPITQMANGLVDVLKYDDYSTDLSNFEGTLIVRKSTQRT